MYLGWSWKGYKQVHIKYSQYDKVKTNKNHEKWLFPI